MFKTLIPRIMQVLDNYYKKHYSDSKNNLVQEIVKDYSTQKKYKYFVDFIDKYDRKPVEELYNIINGYYNSRLSELIVEGNSDEIGKLKYLLLLVLDMKDNLYNNSK